MNTIHIALDIETLSKRPTAAIISIAAKCFTFAENTGEMPLDAFKAFLRLHTIFSGQQAQPGPL